MVLQIERDMHQLEDSLCSHQPSSSVSCNIIIDEWVDYMLGKHSLRDGVYRDMMMLHLRFGLTLCKVFTRSAHALALSLLGVHN